MSETLKFQPPPKKATKNTNAGPGLFTRRHVAEILGISDAQIYRACMLGEIKTVTFGGRDYIPLSEVERLRKLLSGEL